jgi:hypothetical protein
VCIVYVVRSARDVTPHAAYLNIDSRRTFRAGVPNSPNPPLCVGISRRRPQAGPGDAAVIVFTKLFTDCPPSGMYMHRKLLHLKINAAYV